MNLTPKNIFSGPDARTLSCQLRMRSLAASMEGGVRYLLPVEVSALIGYAGSHEQKILFRLLWNTGMRVSEALALTARDCILTQDDEVRLMRRRGARKSDAVTKGRPDGPLRDSGGSPLLPQVIPDDSYQAAVLVRSLKRHCGSATRGKPTEAERRAENAAKRLIPLLDPAFAADLKSYRDGVLFGPVRRALDEPLWTVSSRQSVLNWINAAVTRAAADGVQFSVPVSPHTFRHSYAMYMLNAGVTDRLLMALMGHRSLKTLGIYTRVFALDRLSGSYLPFDCPDARDLLKNVFLVGDYPQERCHILPEE
ncbi:tyrosine-type recombinase/integrase [Erwinia tasmaniensis]|uniref:Integrases, DNA breaking-rejoining enzymes n=1 Tax=Erwinia tasmaniensis (strain DSM 17950 / CFBP 7177 / CIP 109463 / NCPPB 4357 / Et1/99) TaxID=465817 RepID=B2VB47_ERWT9|nr:tyrosine-type recombinase/integrase [Erwinia tasmaniensis]CAO94983.1 Putative integrases, DNA breaking-rejoining enzymes [Erwinia tasmaniensis Et1/99]